MIPAVRWRRSAQAMVVVADIVLLLIVVAQRPGGLPFALPLFVGATAWALLRPGSSGSLTLVVVQVFTVGTSRTVPASVTDWAVAAVAAALVLVTHLALALLAAWPPGAALPRTTATRWGRQAGLLAAVGGVAALVGSFATATPVGWGPWVGALALLAVAGTTTLIWLGVARRR